VLRVTAIRIGGLPGREHRCGPPSERPSDALRRGWVLSVRQLLPLPLDPVDPVSVYGDPPVADGRPSVRLNMIASVDGATAVAGVSGGLGGPADRRLFSVLRSLADAVLVAAGTVRAENYGPATLPIAIVSRSCQLDWGSPLFTEARFRPVVVTVADAPAANRARAGEVADVVLAGTDDVDLRVALAALAERGARSVLAEGGPSLNGQLAAAGLLDELCLTVSPVLVGGDAKRILHGAGAAVSPSLELCSVCEDNGFVFLRLRPTAAGPRS
jgi:riboflavin biosynthesis pyrimidine reductase